MLEVMELSMMHLAASFERLDRRVSKSPGSQKIAQEIEKSTKGI